MDAQRLSLGQSESHALKKKKKKVNLTSFIWLIKRKQFYFVKARIADEIDAADHGRANIVVILPFEIAVKESTLSKTIHGLLVIFVRHCEIGLQRC